MTVAVAILKRTQPSLKQKWPAGRKQGKINTPALLLRSDFLPVLPLAKPNFKPEEKGCSWCVL